MPIAAETAPALGEIKARVTIRGETRHCRIRLLDPYLGQVINHRAIYWEHEWGTVYIQTRHPMVYCEKGGAWHAVGNPDGWAKE